MGIEPLQASGPVCEPPLYTNRHLSYDFFTMNIQCCQEWVYIGVESVMGRAQTLKDYPVLK